MEFGNPIIGEEELIRSAIRSQNYLPGVSGWRIAQDGSAEFSNVTIRGTFRAGNDTDYVEGTATPQPHIKFVSSSAATVVPAQIGFQAVGSSTFQLRGPSYLGTRFGQVTFLSTLLELYALNQPVAVSAESDNILIGCGIGSTIRMGEYFDTATDANIVKVDPTNKTFSTYGKDRGRGIMSFTSRNTSTALSAADTVAITSPSHNFEVGRAYRATYHYQGSSNLLTTTVGFRIRRTGLAGTSFFDSLNTHTTLAGGDILNGESSMVFFNNSGSTINDVIVGTVYRPAGAGNVQFFANAANLGWLQIEDIGAIADYPNARAM